MHRFANPARFRRLAARLIPWFGGSAALCISVGLWLALAGSPPDYQQGETVRIMYIHVPAAWNAMSLYAAMAAAGAAALIWRHPLAALAVRALAPIGTAMTVIALATGSLWGQPMWGTWWVWDARLTTVLVLLFLYFAVMVLANAFDTAERGDKAASLLAVIGVVNLPIIKFSVEWWNTLHQPASILRADGPSIDPSMLWPLLIMGVGFSLLAAWLTCHRLLAELALRKASAMRQAVADNAAAIPSSDGYRLSHSSRKPDVEKTVQ